MGKEHTDLNLLGKGLKFLAGALPLLFLSPYLITLSALNKGHWSFYMFIVLGITIGILAVFLIYKGLKTIMKSIF
ncbi:DUF6095 family protein [Patiriisocius marinus]|uniref:Uncharacterized protein n=1 Tax=Patiriisocius marinus TaxID=1397112 RepID=A0A5J4J0F9_9FLAO|nr:DUF6095 family protein [Patiriisocius marinus]GER60824.1 hypothetical protein ULMA_29320 [Patiriisocius marinus]